MGMITRGKIKIGVPINNHPKRYNSLTCENEKRALVKVMIPGLSQGNWGCRVTPITFLRNLSFPHYTFVCFLYSV